MPVTSLTFENGAIVGAQGGPLKLDDMLPMSSGTLIGRNRLSTGYPEHLLAPPLHGVRSKYIGSALSVDQSDWLDLEFNTDDYDTDGYRIDTTTFRIPVGFGGYYELGLSATFGAVEAQRDIRIRRQGSQIALSSHYSGAAQYTAHLHCVCYLPDESEIDCQATQTITATASAVYGESNRHVYFYMHLIGLRTQIVGSHPIKRLKQSLIPRQRTSFRPKRR